MRIHAISNSVPALVIFLFGSHVILQQIMDEPVAANEFRDHLVPEQ